MSWFFRRKPKTFDQEWVLTRRGRTWYNHITFESKDHLVKLTIAGSKWAMMGKPETITLY